jgi:ElaB/YqjD/DUF883 family membrane-anchored ribosome-binding protein
MATAIRPGEAASVQEAPFAWPRLDAVEDAVRKARRAATNARHATEDFAASASLEVRRHPLTAVGLSTAAGVAAGCLFGFAAGWYFTRRG